MKRRFDRGVFLDATKPLTKRQMDQLRKVSDEAHKAARLAEEKAERDRRDACTCCPVHGRIFRKLKGVIG